MNPFSPVVLTLAVNRMKPVLTPVLDTVFKRKKRSLTTPFAWDVKNPSNLLMESIAVDAEATVRDGQGMKHITCPAPRFAEKILITAAQLDEMRRFGKANETTLKKEKVAEEQADMRRSFDLTREFMACKALSGVVVDKNGKQLVDFGLPAEHKPVLVGTALWTDPAGKPIENIRNWQKLISKASGGGVTNWVAFAGTGAMNALIHNFSMQDLLSYTSGKQIAEEGRIARLAKTDIVEHDGSYVDDAGTVHDMIPDNIFALVGVVQDGAAELYAPPIDLDAPGGVGKGKEADIYFSKMWPVQDPSGEWVKVEGRPLPVLTRIIVVWAQVI